MATMQNIADKLGLTKSTVSKALSGASDISASTRQAVIRTARELGYTRAPGKPDPLRLAVFVQNMDYTALSDMGQRLFNGFQKAASAAGFLAELIPFSAALQKKSGYDAFIQKNGYAGAMLLGFSLSDPWMQDLRTFATPTAIMDNHIHTNPNVTYIGVDNQAVMDTVVERLIALGHRRIGYLGGSMGSYIFQVRYRDFFHSLKHNRLYASRDVGGYSFYLSECMTHYLPKILEQGVTAIVCGSDFIAQSLLLQCMDRNIRVPDDLSVIGFDDQPVCAYTSPPLSSIRQEFESIGEIGFESLRLHLEGKPVSKYLLHGKLIERGSIGPAPKKGIGDAP